MTATKGALREPDLSLDIDSLLLKCLKCVHHFLTDRA
jgi:hypothetical protein